MYRSSRPLSIYLLGGTGRFFDCPQKPVRKWQGTEEAIRGEIMSNGVMNPILSSFSYSIVGFAIIRRIK